MAKTILLVDDEPHILETAQDILEAAGYAVQTAETGAAALQKLAAGPADVMIVDFNLLDTTGIDLALQAKALQPSLLIMLMTGETDLDLGPAKSVIRDILIKPVDPAKLIALLHKIS